MSTKYKTNWNLDLLVKDFDDSKLTEEQVQIKSKVDIFINKWNPRNDYLSDPKVLTEAINEYELLFREKGLEGNTGLYLYLKSCLDQTNADVKARLNKVDEFSRNLYNNLQFFTHRIALIEESKQLTILQYADLSDYRHFLTKLFQEGKYLLSEAEEKILNLKAKTSSSNWIQLTSELLAKEEGSIINSEGKKEKKNFSEIISLMDNKNKPTRDSAAKVFNKVMSKWVDVAEAEINSILESKKINDDLRKVKRPDFFRHLSDDIESEVVDSLIESVSTRFDISRRFYNLKSKLLGVDKLEYHERNLEIGKVVKKYTFDDGVDLVKKVFSDLDPEFNQIFSNFLENGEIDVYPQKGKINGAFCLSNLNTQPIYLLLNHNDKLNDVLTLAHEAGHGIHFELAKKQNSLNFGASLATAEVASTFMEDFVLEEILKDADDEMKLELMMSKLNDDISTIIRQVACYKFETDLHVAFKEKGYLSKKDIGKLFQNNMKEYMGDSVKQSKGSENWWIYWSHIRNFFYVYSYASGLLISKSLQKSTRENKEFIKKVKIYFEAGKSDTARNIFLNLGIDIADRTFWEKGLENISEYLDEAEMLAKKLGKIN